MANGKSLRQHFCHLLAFATPAISTRDIRPPARAHFLRLIKIYPALRRNKKGCSSFKSFLGNDRRARCSPVALYAKMPLDLLTTVYEPHMPYQICDGYLRLGHCMETSQSSHRWQRLSIFTVEKPCQKYPRI